MPSTLSSLAPAAPPAAVFSAARSCFETIAAVIGLDSTHDSSLLTCASVRLALWIVGSNALSSTTSAEIAR